MRREGIIVFFIFLILLIYGCGGGTVIRDEKDIIATYERGKRVDTLNEKLILEAMMKGTAKDLDYIIGSEDLLEIDVFQVEELKRTVRVSAQGNIGIPLIGTVKAKGLTAIGLEKEIAKKFSDRYLEDPLVTVYIREYRAQKISVLGAVAKPQIYAVSGMRYLLDLLAMADGITRDAGNICYVLRPVNPSENNPSVNKTETIVIDLNALLVEGDSRLNIPVFSGDVIHVPKAGMVFVDGAVQKPGAFPLQAKTTLVQVIAMAEGARYEADKSDVRIFRDNGKGEREVIKINYEEVREGRGQDFLLQANDIIIVPKSGIKNFFSGFINTIKGLFSMGKSL
ncbi:MAG: polysaccharide biosynthesis/export family protein [Nitrospirae bacterium]|nr:polysaccharide biosynthesis/export family protein [Nitrospirota bacterium]